MDWLELAATIERVLREFPKLDMVRTDEGIHIHLKEGGTESLGPDNLVGTYTPDGLSDTTAEEMVREDCEAFFKA